MREISKAHLRVLVIYLVIISLLRFEIPRNFSFVLDLAGLWVGGLIGMALLGLDRLVHVYVERPGEELSVAVKQLIGQRNYRQALENLLARRREQTNLAFRNGVFALVMLPVAFFAFTSTSGMFGKGLVAGVMLHFLYDAWRDLLRQPEYFKSWFLWMIRKEFSLEEQRMVLVGISGAFIFFSFLLA